ncbi:MAG: HAD family hydrolase [Gammaproteobacteria bacterium]|mgnify:FL=1|jgi:HAD superfamily hydrolase (TIGR01509 family)|nr:HAD family hydrolase [Gammaproteobacteria bacterium]
MIKVIAFDLDDTLWEVGPVIRRAESILAHWLEKEVPEYRYEPAKLMPIRETLLREDPTLGHRLTAFRQRLIEISLAPHLDQESAASCAEGAMEIFLTARNDVEFFEGALETLRELTGSFQLGALTNGNADINRLGLNSCFSFAFSAEQVGAPKPAPDLFQAALAHTGCEPAQMVYVGDDAIKDVDAANQVGLHTVWLRPKSKPVEGESSPDEIINDIRELPGAIKKLVGR